MHVFESLARDQKLLCPETRAPVRIVDGRVVSSSGRDLGPTSGPLNFLEGYRDTLDSVQVPRTDIDRMRAQLELPQTAEIDAAIAEAIAATGAQFPQRHLSAEARILAERFRMPAFELGDTEPARGSVVARVASAFARLWKGRPEYRLETISDSVGERLSAGLEVFRSVRVRNGSDEVLPAGQGQGARIVTEFASPDGTAIAATRVYSPLPVNIEPGREITLILRFRAPPDSGPCLLRARLVVQGREAARPFLEKTVEAIPCELPVFEYSYHPDVLEYGADHHIAMLEMAEFLEQRHEGVTVSILEVGGGVHPTGHSIALRGHRVVASDISHAQSILGTLYFRHKMPALDESLGFISCDGLDLPFATGAFDGVMMVAAFHHFANPRLLLEELKRVTRPQGFIYLACETCVPNPEDVQYREELSRGINEQMWTLAEFTAYFRDAGLEPARARVDGNSLKVVLLNP